MNRSARSAAVEALSRILDRGQTLDEATDISGKGLEPRDRAFLRSIVLASLRHKGAIEFLMGRYLSRPLPKSGRVAHLAILSGAAQLLIVGSPAHAVVNEQVNLIAANSKFRGVVNAVLRRFDRNGAKDIADPKVQQRNLPGWLWKRWRQAYGAEPAMAMAAAQSLDNVPLDISVTSDASGWAERLGGVLLPTGSIRLTDLAPVQDLPGYQDGAWWVQDAAAALQVRLFGDLNGKRMLDACAAPGGKTAQAIAAGADVTALDRSAKRLEVLRTNLSRLNMTADIVTQDFQIHEPGEPYDAILLDAPCSATGTLRRHPDIGWTRSEADIASLVKLQSELLETSAAMLKPGGMLVYCTCSLEQDEGEDQIERFLSAHPDFRRKKIRADELGVPVKAVSKQGDLRTRPDHMLDLGGMDGFFAARLIKQ